MRLGLPEILIILFVVLLLFGAGRLPGLAKSLGQGFQEFRKGIAGDQSEREKPTRKRRKTPDSPA
ncbi:MAG: twin-arginine translocase TatA/TatE family subunit [Chloroflexi bacterium]|nr:twin-arginine translocase TatA/TatE family subunit [Chloroflexota bacterium]